MTVQKIFEVLGMSYMCKMVVMFFICLFASVSGFAQEQSKTFLQLITIDSTIQCVQIKTDQSKEKPYHNIAWEAAFVVIECKVSVNTEAIIEFPSDDYKISTTINEEKLIIDLKNARSGVFYINGKRLEVKAVYRILTPNNLIVKEL